MDLEWLEGHTLYMALRFMRGEPVYVPLDSGYLPFPYPPLYHGVVGVLGHLAGLDYAVGRAVSALCFMLAVATLAHQAWEHAGGGGAGAVWALVVAAGCCAGFPAVGGWYDLARIDTMAATWPVLAGALLAAQRLGTPRVLAAAALMTAALYTKQNAILYVAWMHVFVFARDRRRAVLMGLATGYLGLVLFLWMQATTGGWFRYWLFAMGDQQVVASRAREGLGIVLGYAPYLPALPVLAAVLAWRRRLSARSVLWCGMLATGGAGGLMAYLVPAGYLNNLIPLCLLAAPVAALLAIDALRSTGRAAWAQPAVWGLAVAWLGGARYDPEAFVPPAGQWAAARALTEEIRALPGGVLVPNHPFQVVRAGKDTPQFHTMTYWDAWSGRRLGLDLMSYVEASGARWVMLHGGEGLVREQMYRVFREPRPIDNAPATITGYPSQLRFLAKRVDKVRRRVLFDFESGRFDGWTVSGDAFEHGPITARHADYPFIMGHEGMWLASSYHATHRDGATGSLASPPFVIDHDYLSVLVGGGEPPSNRLDLRVDGEVVLRTGGSRSEFLRQVTFDLRRFRGRTAQIAVVDEDDRRWGHILADHVQVFDLAP
jgi:hypothetical protein